MAGASGPVSAATARAGNGASTPPSTTIAGSSSSRAVSRSRVVSPAGSGATVAPIRRSATITAMASADAGMHERHAIARTHATRVHRAHDRVRAPGQPRPRHPPPAVDDGEVVGPVAASSATRSARNQVMRRRPRSARAPPRPRRSRARRCPRRTARGSARPRARAGSRGGRARARPTSPGRGPARRRATRARRGARPRHAIAAASPMPVSNSEEITTGTPCSAAMDGNRGDGARPADPRRLDDEHVRRALLDEGRRGLG